MKDVSGKSPTLRTASARAFLRAAPATLDALRSGAVPKADPLGVSRVAGIQAAKQTSVLIPYCHQIPLDSVQVNFTVGPDGIEITTGVTAVWKTGVEMEALVSASAAALTLYDMLNAIDTSLVIESIRLTEKKGGKSSYSGDGRGLKAAVLVLSDSANDGSRPDMSGPALAEGIAEFGMTVLSCTVLPDDRSLIEKTLIRLADEEKADLICTTGGTGIGPRDVTPEATAAVIDRRLQGIEETLRRYGQERIPYAMLSRGIAGLRGKTLIVNFPGSPAAVREGLQAIFPAVLHVFPVIRAEKH